MLPLLPWQEQLHFLVVIPISVRTAHRLTKTLYSQHGWCLWLFRLGPGCGFDSLPINLPKCLWKISKYLKGSMSNLEKVPTWLNEIKLFQGRRDRSGYHSLMGMYCWWRSDSTEASWGATRHQSLYAFWCTVYNFFCC